MTLPGPVFEVPRHKTLNTFAPRPGPGLIPKTVIWTRPVQQSRHFGCSTGVQSYILISLVSPPPLCPPGTGTTVNGEIGDSFTPTLPPVSDVSGKRLGTVTIRTSNLRPSPGQQDYPFDPGSSLFILQGHRRFVYLTHVHTPLRLRTRGTNLTL